MARQVSINRLFYPLCVYLLAGERDRSSEFSLEMLKDAKMWSKDETERERESCFIKGKRENGIYNFI